jgi:hypothetical protein
VRFLLHDESLDVEEDSAIDVGATCDELFLRNNSHYEKINHSHFCAFDGRLDANVLLKRTRDDYGHDASN